LTRIKICGITEPVYARAALEAGADFIGLVFAPSPRQITGATAMEISAAVKAEKSDTSVVGVFVNMPASEVNEVASRCRADYVQLSGDETWDYCLQIERPVIKAVHVYPDSDEQGLLTGLNEGRRILSSKQVIYMLDTRIDDRYGGTGQIFRWGVAKRTAERFPVIIAGGLTPDNVGEVVSQLKPYGVDVSSGVEVDGIKSIEKINAFVKAVRSAVRPDNGD
jgi:phosphoribosylanthranilate isomerase